MANGEGYLRQRANGSWTITVFLGKDDKGKPRQLIKTVRGTKADAQNEMARLVLERDQGVDLRPEIVTFAELATRWLDSKRNDLSASTVSTYDTLLTIHVVPVVGKLKVREIKPLNVESLKTAVLSKGDSSKSALNVFRLTNAVLKQAVRWQLISHNPCDGVQAPRPPHFTPYTPSPDELEHLLQVADQTPYGPVARLAVLTGARQGELLGLQWRHMDWQERRVFVPGTKTRASARVVDLGPDAIDLLTRHRKAEIEKRLKLGPGTNCGTDDATIFTNGVGKAMDAGGLKRSWKGIIKKAGVGHVRFHDLRHASATYMLQAGVPVKVVSERLGHSRTSTTTDTYAHVMPGMGREAAETLERVMRR